MLSVSVEVAKGSLARRVSPLRMHLKAAHQSPLGHGIVLIFSRSSMRTESQQTPVAEHIKLLATHAKTQRCRVLRRIS